MNVRSPSSYFVMNEVHSAGRLLEIMAALNQNLLLALQLARLDVRDIPPTPVCSYEGKQRRDTRLRKRTPQMNRIQKSLAVATGFRAVRLWAPMLTLAQDNTAAPAPGTSHAATGTR